MKQIGSVIKNTRKRKGLKQNFIAKKAGISREFLSEVENNHKYLSLENLRKVSLELGLPVQVLFYLSIEPDDVPTAIAPAFEKVSEKIKKMLNDFFFK